MRLFMCLVVGVVIAGPAWGQDANTRAHVADLQFKRACQDRVAAIVAQQVSERSEERLRLEGYGFTLLAGTLALGATIATASWVAQRAHMNETTLNALRTAFEGVNTKVSQLPPLPDPKCRDTLQEIAESMLVLRATLNGLTKYPEAKSDGRNISIVLAVAGCLLAATLFGLAQCAKTSKEDIVASTESLSCPK